MSSRHAKQFSERNWTREISFLIKHTRSMSENYHFKDGKMLEMKLDNNHCVQLKKIISFIKHGWTNILKFCEHHWNNTQAIRILHSTFFKRELESKLRANFTQNTYFCFIPQVYQSICSSKKLSLNETSFTMYYSLFSVTKKPSAELWLIHEKWMNNILE